MAFTKEVVGELQILTSAVLFGLAFVGSRQATTDPAGPFTFNAWRFAISTVVLLALRKPLKKALDSDINDNDTVKPLEDIPLLISIKNIFPSDIKQETFDLYFWGIVCGLSNFAMSTFLQFGMLTVPVGKAAFINGLFVVVTPFAELLLPGAKNHISGQLWLSVLLSVVGTYFLSDAESTSIGVGEMLVMCSTISSSCNIISADCGAKRVDCVDLTMVEFSTNLILSTLMSLCFEPNLWAWPLYAFQQGWMMIVFVGITEGAAFLISTIGQMHSTSSARSALIFSLEAVFTAILGYLILGEALTNWEMVGCALMFAATLISSASLAAEEEGSALTAEGGSASKVTELSALNDSTPLVESINGKTPSSSRGVNCSDDGSRIQLVTSSYGSVSNA